MFNFNKSTFKTDVDNSPLDSHPENDSNVSEDDSIGNYSLGKGKIDLVCTDANGDLEKQVKELSAAKTQSPSKSMALNGEFVPPPREKVKKNPIWSSFLVNVSEGKAKCWRCSHSNIFNLDTRGKGYRWTTPMKNHALSHSDSLESETSDTSSNDGDSKDEENTEVNSTKPAKTLNTRYEYKQGEGQKGKEGNSDEAKQWKQST